MTRRLCDSMLPQSCLKICGNTSNEATLAQVSPLAEDYVLFSGCHFHCGGFGSLRLLVVLKPHSYSD